MKVFDEVKHYAKKPEIYAEGSLKLWEDPYIAKGMLEAHLSPGVDAASRKHSFIDESVEWIAKIAHPTTHPKLIDFGCGPGMYTSRLALKGYEVTGIDISSNSITYAKEKAKDLNIDVDYRLGNYLEFEEKEKYDIAILIYCDYGALSDENRIKVLQNISRAIKPGGKIVLDVFTPNQYTGKAESSEWSISGRGDFFKEEEYLCLESHMIYSDFVRLNQYVIVDQGDNVDVVRVWDHCFTKESLEKEVAMPNLKVEGFFSDVTGTLYRDDSKTIAVVLEVVC